MLFGGDFPCPPFMLLSTIPGSRISPFKLATYVPFSFHLKLLGLCNVWGNCLTISLLFAEISLQIAARFLFCETEKVNYCLLIGAEVSITEYRLRRPGRSTCHHQVYSPIGHLKWCPRGLYSLIKLMFLSHSKLCIIASWLISLKYPTSFEVKFGNLIYFCKSYDNLLSYVY